MTYKQLNTAREIRLWITGVIVPATVFVKTVQDMPEIKKTVKSKYDVIKEKIKKK